MKKVFHLVSTDVNHTRSIFQMGNWHLNQKMSTLFILAGYEVPKCSNFRIGRIYLSVTALS